MSVGVSRAAGRWLSCGSAKKSALVVVLERDGKNARWHKESEVLVI
jgi:hypothetical protein